MSHGTFFFEKEVVIDLIIGGDAKVENLTEIHKKAYEYLMKNQKKILTIILKNLLDKYPVLQKEYGYNEEEQKKYMPNISEITEFKGILQPKRIHILNVENDGMMYLGFHFTCLWDEEHDFGVMMSRERIVKMGGAEAAFLSWIAEEDKRLSTQN